MLTRLFIVLFLSTVSCFIEEKNDDKEGLLFGGDMMLTPEQKIIVETGGDLSKSTKIQPRAATSISEKLWMNNNKVIPYVISDELDNEPAATLGLMKALREWEEHSCISFKRREGEKDFVNFIKDNGCWSYVGRLGGGQNISLGKGCWGIGTIVHEIGHAVGFGHEQNRPDRDQYIKIRWENIKPGKEHNFNKYNDSKVDSFGSPYDYKSFMQYSKSSFGINDSVTLDPLRNITQLGQRVGFTEQDEYQAMKLYKCDGKPTRTPETFVHHKLEGYHNCDFENGFCEFTQDERDDFDWTQRYGGTPTSNTGPPTDHTTLRIGTFLYVEASSPRTEGDKARLLSKWFPATNDTQCLSFFLHMHAKNESMMGEFRVDMNDDAGKNQTLLEKKGSQKVNDWINIKMTFKPKGQYQIVFEGVRGWSYQSDIALDDISFHSKECPKTTTTHKERTRSPTGVPDNICKDTTDRESHYCQKWKEAGFCKTERRHMNKFCRKTCSYCKEKKNVVVDG